jgi:tetratricopeptide (TPR) repeat protein
LGASNYWSFLELGESYTHYEVVWDFIFRTVINSDWLHIVIKKFTDGIGGLQNTVVKLLKHLIETNQRLILLEVCIPTVKDLFIWSEAVKSYTLLSPELTKVMLTPNKHGHCYGWVRTWDDIIEKNINVRLHGHGGALAGNSAFIALYDNETTIIYLSNRSNLKAEEILHQIYLRANNLKDEHKLQGYPNRSSYTKFIAAGGMIALQDYFNRLSAYSGYKVNPSNSTMKGVMKIHLEAGKTEVADSLKTVFLNFYNPDERTLNEFGYDFLNSDTPEFALEFLKENTLKFPNSSNTWDSLGEAYLAYKDYEKAVSSYQKAVDLGKEVSHKSLKIYKENLQKAENKLKG